MLQGSSIPFQKHGECDRQSIQRSHQATVDTVAFWGGNAFSYMLEASQEHSYTYTNKTYTNTAFLGGRIYAGVIWSNCNPHTDTLVINIQTTACFIWWPALISISSCSEIYAKCQDFAFTRGRPRAIDISRCHRFHQVHGPVMLTPVPEGCMCEYDSDDDVSTTTGDCTSIALTDSTTNTNMSDGISSTFMSSLQEMNFPSIAWPSSMSGTSDLPSSRSSSSASWELVE